jgi:DNA-binding transcriptional LysR family regulator
VTQAAASLGVAQPAISQAITSLERQFGVTIFDRARPFVNFVSERFGLADSMQQEDEE